MAEFNPINYIGFQNPSEAIKLQQQQALAAQLMAESEPRKDINNVVGNGPYAQVAPYSPLEGLSKALQKGIGAYAQKDANEQLAKALTPTQTDLMGTATNAAIQGEGYGPATKEDVADKYQTGLASALQGQGNSMKYIQMNAMSPGLGTEMYKRDTAAAMAAETEAAKAPYNASSMIKGADDVPRPVQSFYPAQGAKPTQPLPASLQSNEMSPQGNGGPVVFSNERPETGGIKTKTQVETDTQAAKTGIDELYKTSKPAAEKARDGIISIQNARDAFKSGMFTGGAAEQKLQMAKFAKAAGFLPPEFDETVANTQVFQSTMGRQVLSLVKNLGSGSGISDADREFARDIAGGKISLDEKTFPRLLDIGEAGYKYQINKHNRDVEEASKITKFPYSPKVEMPEEMPAEAVTTPKIIRFGADGKRVQ